MEKLIGSKDYSLTSINDAFCLYMPQHIKIEQISFKNLPKTLQQEIKSEEQCELALKITHWDSTETAILKPEEMDMIMLNDLNSGKLVGEGYIHLEEGLESSIPAVGFTSTKENHKKSGLGTRRLFVMNALSRGFFNEPLSSSGSPKPVQKAIWERLVREEYATPYEWEGTKRYKFI